MMLENDDFHPLETDAKKILICTQYQLNIFHDVVVGISYFFP